MPVDFDSEPCTAREDHDPLHMSDSGYSMESTESGPEGIELEKRRLKSVWHSDVGSARNDPANHTPRHNSL